MDTAWMVVGKAQRDVPAHIAQEYCRPDRSFSPTPQFTEDEFPRTLTFHNNYSGDSDSWFPLPASNAGLGFDYALLQMGMWVHSANPMRDLVAVDLAAVTRLDEVRTIDLRYSRDNLNPANAPGISM
jgi:hypothetical protein